MSLRALLPAPHVRPTLRVLLCGLMLHGCAHGPTPASTGTVSASAPLHAPVPEAARDVVLAALGLVDIDYKFGGKNPEAGLDCSGLVNLVYARALNRPLGRSAAEMAQRGRAIDAPSRQPGDLLFFNTRGGPYTHVGIYLGDGRFIHAPSSKGKVRIEPLDGGWFASRLTEVRRYVD